MIKGVELKVEGVKIGYIFVKNARVGDSYNLNIIKEIEKDIDKIVKEEEKRKIVRDMLRFGKYKPSGRGKPASEYLYEIFKKRQFPLINNFVDCLNLVSLKSLLPISLIDVDKAGSERFLLRRGKSGESYIFNNSGQVLNLEDLLLISTFEKDEPIATPVKDSQKTKIDFSTKNLIAVIYCPLVIEEDLKNAMNQLINLYKNFGEIDDYGEI